MKHVFAVAVAATLIVSGVAAAQDHELDLNADYQASPSDLQAQPVPSQLSPSAEQHSRQVEAAQAVRRKAEFRAAQRMNRIATRQWTGNSAFRPRVSTIPVMAPNTTFWGGNINARFVWIIAR